MTKYSFVEYKIVSQCFEVEAESLEEAKKICWETDDRYHSGLVDVGDEQAEGFSGDIQNGGSSFTDYIFGSYFTKFVA